MVIGFTILTLCTLGTTLRQFNSSKTTTAVASQNKRKNFPLNTNLMDKKTANRTSDQKKIVLTLESVHKKTSIEITTVKNAEKNIKKSKRPFKSSLM